MPIFEYKCNVCEKTTEVFFRNGAIPECAHCGSKKLSKQISVFAVNKSSGESVPPSCAAGCGGFNKGTCGSGMCGACGDD